MTWKNKSRALTLEILYVIDKKLQQVLRNNPWTALQKPSRNDQIPLIKIGCMLNLLLKVKSSMEKL